MAKIEHSPEIKRLFDEVYANPDDDAARLVLSDALIEINDPRGHFIALQFGKSVGKVDARKEQKLLRQFSEEWCAPIGQACFQRTFERGFIGRATTRDDLIKDNMIGDRAWSTIRLLTIMDPIRGSNQRRKDGEDEQIRLLLMSEPIRMWTRTIEGLPPDVAEDVLLMKQLRRWRDITARSDRAERMVDSISRIESESMPELRRLDITFTDRTVMSRPLSHRLLQSPIVRSLDILGITSEGSDALIVMLNALGDLTDPSKWPARLSVTSAAGMITLDLRGERAGTIHVGLIRDGGTLSAALGGLAPIKSTFKSATIVRAREAGWNSPQLSADEWEELSKTAGRIASQVRMESIP